MYYSTTCPSPVGVLTLACDRQGENLVGLWMEGQKYHGGDIAREMVPNHDVPLFKTIKNWLESYFAAQAPDPSGLPLAPAGSAFRRGVWEILREIPYGEFITYSDIARRVAQRQGLKSMSGQAVGGAVGHNPISIIIPCHRVVGSNGSLTGFSAGLRVKTLLLELEGVDTSRFFAPKRGTAI
jgi:methylated-DNA-[protein]-cysteine S-methyltransferase